MTELFSVKVYETLEGKMITICDPEVVGKRFEENSVVLDVDEKYYSGELLSGEEAVDLARNSRSVSFIGEKAVRLAVENKLIHPQAVARVKGIPHAMYINVL